MQKITVHGAFCNRRAITVDKDEYSFYALCNPYGDGKEWFVYHKGEHIGNTRKVRQIEFLVISHLKINNAWM
jgi:hypothetical protein